MEPQNTQNLTEIMSSKPMKKLAKLLVSLSLFSILFSYKIWFSHSALALDKNYMFLICNGILVLLAKTSRRMSQSHHAPMCDSLIINENFQTTPYYSHAKPLDCSLCDKEPLGERGVFLLENVNNFGDTVAAEEEKRVIVEEAIEEAEGDCRCLGRMMDMEEDYGMCIAGGDGDDSDSDGDDDDEEVKKVVEERERLNELSDEELNKRFEEFIRKTKEDIRIEAHEQQQKQLVLVK